MSTAAEALEPTETVEATANDPQPEAPPIHGLFWPQKEGDREIVVRYFTISREVEGRPREDAGQLFAAADILDLPALVRRFGGGTYYLKARTERAVLVPGGSRQYVVNPDEHPPLPMVPVRARPAAVAQQLGAAASPLLTAPAPVAPPAPAGIDMASLVQALGTMQKDAVAQIAQAYAAADKVRAESAAQTIKIMETMMGAKLDSAGVNSIDKIQQARTDGMAEYKMLLKEAREEVTAQQQQQATTGDSLKDVNESFELASRFLPLLNGGPPKVD